MDRRYRKLCRPDSCAGCINAACCGKLTSEVSLNVAEAPSKAAASGDTKQVKQDEKTSVADNKTGRMLIGKSRDSAHMRRLESQFWRI